MIVGQTGSVARARALRAVVRARQTPPRSGGTRPLHASARLNVLSNSEECSELSVHRSHVRSSNLRFRAPRLRRWRRGRKAALRLARKASTAAQCGHRPHRPRQCIGPSGASDLAHVASWFIGPYAAQQAAAPVGGPVPRPALKRLVRSGLRPLRRRHVKPRRR
jgi:hypothetical protein